MEIGIYLNSSRGSRVEENLFNTFPIITNSQAQRAVGIVINDNGPVSDIIYRNAFTKLSQAIQFIGNNRSVGDNGITGYQFRCNDFRICFTDVSLPDAQSSTAYGVRKNQGDPNPLDPDNTPSKDLAGNIFSQGTFNFMHVNNTSSPIIQYHHHQTSSEPEATPVNNNFTTPYNYNVAYDPNLSCPTKLTINPNGDTLSVQDYTITEAELDYNLNKTEGDLVEGLLSTLVDGGNTWQLEAQILFAQQSQYLSLYTDLMNESPYLSDEILAQTIQIDDLPDLMLRNILVANPQSSKNEWLMELLEVHHENIPSYMLSDIMAGQSTLGGKEILEIELSAKRTTQYQAADYLLREYAHSDLEDRNTKMRSIFSDLPQAFYQYQLAEMEVFEENFAAAQQVLDDILTNNELSEWEDNNHSKNLDWYAMYLDLAENGEEVCSLNGSQISNLNEWGNESSHRGSYARGALNMLGVPYTYLEPMYDPSHSSSSNKKEQAVQKKEDAQTRIYPNPAQNFVAIELGNFTPNEKIWCYLYAMDGRLIKQALMKSTHEIFELGAVLPGSYILKIGSKEQNYLTEKLIVQQ
jgi:hypothetical protein